MLINPLDRDDLRKKALAAKPFPNICIDDFLEESFAQQVLEAMPSFEELRALGRTFAAVNERGKVQTCDADKFARPISELNRALAAPEFLDLLSHVFGIPGLVADEQLVGGGIHQTGPRGHLDVHVDFNYIKDRDLHRRLNILVYFNRDWHEEWGGHIELWDRDVRVCHQSLAPIFNRCFIFETSEISFHGVSAVKCPPDRSRKSFAAYYYTKEAPKTWDGRVHSTVFKARPQEVFKGKVQMPIERAKRWARLAVRKIKGAMTG